MINFKSINDIPNNVTDLSQLYGMYIDFPPTYNEYMKQKITTDIDAAISFIFRSLYGDYRLLPQVQGLFIDIQRYKHILDSEGVRNNLTHIVNISLSAVLEGMQPNIEVSYDPVEQRMMYLITIRGEIELEVDDAQDPMNATIKINNKKFYE